MPELYVDNYRGFKNTFITLKKVNFLVGENSSGKTSLLKLMKVLSDQTFWLHLDFNIPDTELGYFSEIATRDSGKNYFDVGILADSWIGEDNVYAIKMRFGEEDGQPKVQEIKMFFNGMSFQAILGGNTTKYRINKVPYADKAQSAKQEFFKRWINDTSLKNKSFKQDPEKDRIHGRTGSAFFHLTDIFERELKEQSSEFIYIPFAPNFLNDLVWAAPIRTEPRRTYDSYKSSFNPDGTHSPYILKNLLKKKKGSKLRDRVEKTLAKFGK